MLRNDPAAGEGQGEHLRDIVGLKRSRDAAAEVDKSAQFLNFLLEFFIAAQGGFVRLRIGDGAGRQAEKRRDEIFFLGFQKAARGMADGENANGAAGLLDGKELFELSGPANLFREERALRERRHAARERDAHAAIKVDGDDGFAH